MARVPYNTPVNSSGSNNAIEWVLCSRVVLDQFPYKRIRVRVDVCRHGSRPNLAYVVWYGNPSWAKPIQIAAASR
jgi:hypothetical protein